MNRSALQGVQKDVGTSMSDYSGWVESAWPRLFRTAYALTGDVHLAEELLQEALVKLFVAWHRVSGADAPDAYARRVMVNLATSRWRARRRRPEVLAPDVGAAISVRGFEGELTEADALWRVICGLPPRQRAVVVLRYYEDLSEQQIAAVMAVSPGTVKSLASAAMSKLRSAYTDEELGARP